MEELIFVQPSMEYAQELMAYKQEFLDTGDSMDGCGPLRRHDTASGYLAEAALYTSPETLPEGKVLATQFLCVNKATGMVVGMIQIRHYLNEYLQKYSGHIGYSVRPSQRRKGYASWMLKNVLPYCKKLGLDKIMVACLDDNEGSRRTILKNGGVFSGKVFEPNEQEYLEQYWITL